MGNAVDAKLLRHSQVELSKIDMCAYGLVSPRDVPMKKSTGILHNIPALSPMLVLRCDGSHKHDRIEGSISGCKSSTWAQKYPKFLCQTLAGGIQQQIHWDQGIQFEEAHQVSEYVKNRTGRPLGAFPLRIPKPITRHLSSDAKYVSPCLTCHPCADDGPEAEADESDDEGCISQHHDRLIQAPASACPVAAGDADDLEAVTLEESAQDDPNRPKTHLPGGSVRKLENLVQRAHEQLGHPGIDKFVRILRLGGASDEAIQIARDLECSTCQRTKTPSTPRKSAMPPSADFNQTIGIDLFFVDNHDRTKKVPVLSIIDWGTLFHQACVLKDKTAGRVRRAYRRLWLRVSGPPRKIVSDQGLEFVGREFSERLEADGTLHAITGADAPWQNARTERHGGTLKKMISRARLDVAPESKDDLE